MKIKLSASVAVIPLAGLYFLSAAGGCNSRETAINLKPIVQAALPGAALGWIIGHQSEEDGEGIAVGVSVFSLAALWGEIERVEEAKKDTTVWVPNPDGSFSPVIIRQKRDFYVGPQGEYYKEIPTPEQLQMRYGLKKDKEKK
ncbi:MAG: hypothetical protein AMJ79_05430 [Phycisphaerae bacterium SM23_30]|nr:MAG: hypothetical protein AMJ79_05430 [Phycisphaerae bacterium SM23_30]